MKRNYLLWISLSLNILGVAMVALLIHRLGGWHYFKYRLAQRGVAAEYEHRKSLYETMNGDTASIVFLGNSLTAQCDWAELLGQPAIKNRGIPGDRINGVRDRLTSLRRLQPKKIFLMIGINDLLFNPPDEVVRRYRQLVDDIQREFPACQLYLKSVLPVNNQMRNTYIKNEDVQAVNEAVKQIAAEKKMTFIDLRPLLSDREGNLNAGYTSDGVHLNGEAYRIWGEAVADLVGR